MSHFVSMSGATGPVIRMGGAIVLEHNFMLSEEDRADFRARVAMLAAPQPPPQQLKKKRGNSAGRGGSRAEPKRIKCVAVMPQV